MTSGEKHLKFLRICFAIATLVLCVAPIAHARIRAIASYQTLFDKSDLVVIAQPAFATMDTKEKSIFPGFSETDKGGKQRDIKIAAIGVETFFDVSKVLKGDGTIKRLILHHYREAAPSSFEMCCGPYVITFDPANLSKGKDFLLFLIKEKDGRYAPALGQTDPSGGSIFVITSPPP
jgi:hypothetical protein